MPEAKVVLREASRSTALFRPRVLNPADATPNMGQVPFPRWALPVLCILNIQTTSTCFSFDDTQVTRTRRHDKGVFTSTLFRRLRKIMPNSNVMLQGSTPTTIIQQIKGQT